MTRAPAAAPPTPEQLRALSDALGAAVELERRLQGGISCTMDVVRIGATPAVLRRHGPWGAAAGIDLAAREAATLRHLEAAPVPAPGVLWVDDRRIFEQPALIIEHLDGAPLLTPMNHADWATQLAHAARSIHGVPPDDGLADYASEHQSGFAGEAPERFTAHPLGAEIWERLVAMDRPEGRSALIHGDYWPGNTLWRGDRLIGVVDWEVAGVGDPLADLAYTWVELHYMNMPDAARTFLAAYLDGDTLDEDAWRYWLTLAVSRPLPDIAVWVPAWNDTGLDITVAEARERHSELAERVLRGDAV